MAAPMPLKRCADEHHYGSRKPQGKTKAGEELYITKAQDFLLERRTAENAYHQHDSAADEGA